MLNNLLVYRNLELVSHIREITINSEQGLVSYETKHFSSDNWGTKQYRIDTVSRLKIDTFVPIDNKIHLYVVDTLLTTGNFYFEAECNTSK